MPYNNEGKDLHIYMRYSFACYTDKGKRKEVNQDSLLISRAVYHGQEIVLAVICDGMGGLKQGELASAEVVGAFDAWFEESFSRLEDEEEFEDELYESWELLLQDVHQKIRGYGQRRGIQIGTTATVMLLRQQEYYIAHVGDCRIYEIMDQVRQLTKDQVQAELDKEGKENILLQGIGASRMIRPAYYSGEIKEDATYLLCTDGFRHKISEQELLETFVPGELADEEAMEKRGRKITETVIERGEKDNISVILLRTWPKPGTDKESEDKKIRICSEYTLDQDFDINA